jgi:carboxyl-terminal processing protease
LGLLLLAVFCNPAHGSGQQSGLDEWHAQVASQSGQPVDSIEVVVGILREVLQGICELYVEPVSANLLLDAAMDGLQRGLDPHTRLLSPQEFAGLQQRGGGSFGIGVVLDFSDTIPCVREVLLDSPAAEAGLRPGDRILEARGSSLAGINASEVRAVLRGGHGSRISLRVVAPGERPRILAISPRPLQESCVESLLIRRGKVGFVKIHRFGRGTAAALEQILLAWSPQNPDGWIPDGIIIDLRGNPGGFLDEAVNAADLFLPPGEEIVRTMGRLSEETGVLVSVREPLLVGVPRALLVDSLSASSAEIFAGALGSLPNTILLGELTYGKRTVQRIRALSSGGALKVTSSRFRTPTDHVLTSDACDPSSDSWQHPTGVTSSDATAKQWTGVCRLDPDCPLVRQVPASPWDGMERRGLIARFVQERTLSEGDLCELPFWAQATPVGSAGQVPDWDQAVEVAPGFTRWLGRLAVQVKQWGAEAPSEIDQASQGLRHAWFVDWVGERWGDEVRQIVLLELDPWVQRAMCEMDDARTQAAEGSGDVASRIPRPVAKPEIH